MNTLLLLYFIFSGFLLVQHFLPLLGNEWDRRGVTGEKWRKSPCPTITCFSSGSFTLSRSILTPPPCLSHLARIRLRKSHTRYTPQHLLLHVVLFHVEQCLGHPQPDLYTPPDIPLHTYSFLSLSFPYSRHTSPNPLLLAFFSHHSPLLICSSSSYIKIAISSCY